MIIFIIFLTLVGTLIPGLLGRYLGVNASKWWTIIILMIIWCLSLIIFYEIMTKNKYYNLNMGEIILDNKFDINQNYIVNELTVELLIPVSTVSLMVHIYSTGYMGHDPNQQRFFSSISLFTAFMIILIMGGNFYILFVGWEMIGVASYILIGFWHTSINNVKSSVSALLMNKIGDYFLTVAIISIQINMGSINFNILNNFVSTTPYWILTWISVCILIGAMAKSAQILLHTWLLLSMAGPTPVSALLHAACLVCAGIYLLLRTSSIIQSNLAKVVMWIGGFTTIIAGWIATCQNDIKKIIALSTMSQLGMMFLAVGLNSSTEGGFHLYTHAMYKALLFMVAGSVIHATSQESQDIRTLGGYVSYIPITYIGFMIGSLTLMAIPGLSGFYSKDLIIESALTLSFANGLGIYIIAMLSAILTGIYSIKLMNKIFFTESNAPKKSYTMISEWNLGMIVPIGILILGSIFLGYMTKDFFIGQGTSSIAYKTSPNWNYLIETEFLTPLFYKVNILIASIVIIIVYLLLSNGQTRARNLNKFIWNRIWVVYYTILNKKALIDNFYNNNILHPLMKLTEWYSNNIDFGLLYVVGPEGIKAGLQNNMTPRLFARYEDTTEEDAIEIPLIKERRMKKYHINIISTIKWVLLIGVINILKTYSQYWLVAIILISIFLN